VTHQPSLPGLEGPDNVPSGRLGDIYEALPPEERAPYLQALHDRAVPAERLVMALARMGHSVSASLIRTYRRMELR